jgi:glycosyltransferase involved in cell wall biosynthesis
MKIQTAPLFSIIMPVYNTGKYLQRSIPSLLAQTYTNFELIIINDGSTDNSEMYIEEYLKDSRVKYFIQQNQGVSAARNFGLGVAQGKYIYFMDSDDFCRPNLLSVVATSLQKKETDLVVFGYNDMNRNEVIATRVPLKNEIRSLTAKMLLELVSTDLLSRVYNKIFSRSFLLQHQFEFKATKLGEDYLFVLETLTEVKSVTIVADAFYDYDISRDNSAYKKFRSDRLVNLSEQLKYLTLICQRFDDADSINRILTIFKLRSLSSLIMNLFRNDTPLKDADKQKEIKKGFLLFPVTYAQILTNEFISRKIKIKLIIAKVAQPWSFYTLSSLYSVKNK